MPDEEKKKKKEEEAPEIKEVPKPIKKSGGISANSFIRSRGLSAAWEYRLIQEAGKDNLPVLEWERLLKKIGG